MIITHNIFIKLYIILSSSVLLELQESFVIALNYKNLPRISLSISVNESL